MVVSKDYLRGAVSDDVGINFARMDLAAVKKANGYSALFNNFIGTVKRDADEMLLGFSNDVGEQRQYVFRAFNFHSLFQ